jgi:hypothetical protein
LFCGNPERVAILDAWSDHTFMLDTCCEGMHEWAARDLQDDPEGALALMRNEGIEDHFGSPLRRVACDWDGIWLDFELQIRPIGRESAMQFVERHHEHCGRLAGDRFRASIWNGRTMLGVCIVGNPCARAYNGRGWLEVRRLCLDRNVPSTLRWKACSALYDWAAKEAERRGYSKIITYTRKSESGMSLRYARWKCEGPASRDGHSWSSPSRPRPNAKPGEAKIRWSKALRPSNIIPVQLSFAESNRALWPKMKAA